jgi:hypothetical protein
MHCEVYFIVTRNEQTVSNHLSFIKGIFKRIGKDVGIEQRYISIFNYKMRMYRISRLDNYK